MINIDSALVSFDLLCNGNQATVSCRKKRSCNKQWMPSRQALVQTEAQGGGEGSDTTKVAAGSLISSANNVYNCF